jgi:hypothetical protein
MNHRVLLLVLCVGLLLVDTASAVDCVDQSQVSYSGVYSAGDGSSIDNVLAQNFTPTEKHAVGISFYKGSLVGSPTGNLNVSIRTTSGGVPSQTILASAEITPAEFTALPTGFNFVRMPCTFPTVGGSQYWRIIPSALSQGKMVTMIYADFKTKSVTKVELSPLEWDYVKKDIDTGVVPDIDVLKKYWGI